MTTDKPTKFWILANKDNIKGRDKKEVYQDYLEGVDQPMSPQGLSVKIKAILGLSPQYEHNSYPYQPIDLNLTLPDKEELLGQEVADVAYYIQEMNSGTPFSQQELNIILYRDYNLKYKQFKEQGKSVYRYVEADRPHPLGNKQKELLEV